MKDRRPPPDWLPPGKSCAVCFSIDDIHPARSTQGYEAGGDLAHGVLGQLQWLLDRHPGLKATLCVTPDWRPRSPVASHVAARIPWLRDRVYLAPRWPEATMRLDRHPDFCAALRALPRCEIVPHGLHHVQRGPNGPQEFERASESACVDALDRGARIFEAAGLSVAPGHSPPGWTAPPALRRAMVRHGLSFLASARDILTPIAPEAVTAMSGLSGVSLIFPDWTPEGLVHIPANFQATSALDRATAILEAGGLLSLKAHAVKAIAGYVALDGLDAHYAETLDRVLTQLSHRFEDRIWFATMGDVAERFAAAHRSPAIAAER